MIVPILSHGEMVESVLISAVILWQLVGPAPDTCPADIGPDQDRRWILGWRYWRCLRLASFWRGVSATCCVSVLSTISKSAPSFAPHTTLLPWSLT